MLENKDYCDYDTCVSLKELGFDDVTHYNFNKDGVRIPRIPLYEAQKWLREEQNILVIADRDFESWYYAVDDMKTSSYEVFYSKSEFDSYEEALAEGIKEAVKILKDE